ncbi:unnamed protein product [Heligmosomoides polygyrus]|uniref:Dynein light chain n=1 Tax=Heligmosomoides polygyrus TaxID=6339 RepID=A0A183FA87_HELPZ|nr:unnamed protein product [Heligmosomoides polygyrus]
MSEDMQRDAIDCVTQALEKHNNENDIAEYIQEEFDKKYSPSWHCIVGEHYEYCVRPDEKHYILFHLGQLWIALFKSG